MFDRKQTQHNNELRYVVYFDFATNNFYSRPISCVCLTSNPNHTQCPAKWYNERIRTTRQPTDGWRFVRILSSVSAKQITNNKFIIKTDFSPKKNPNVFTHKLLFIQAMQRSKHFRTKTKLPWIAAIQRETEWNVTIDLFTRHKIQQNKIWAPVHTAEAILITEDRKLNTQQPLRWLWSRNVRINGLKMKKSWLDCTSLRSRRTNTTHNFALPLDGECTRRINSTKNTVCMRCEWCAVCCCVLCWVACVK